LNWLTKATAATDSKIAALELQLQEVKAASGGSGGGGTGEETSELQNRISELESRTAYMDQLESELQSKKMQVLAMMENHEEVQKELGELRERAQQLDETSAKAASMEEFLMGLQEERNALAVKLETAEAQITSLAAMLGKVSFSCCFSSQRKRSQTYLVLS
jgi:chromosome segregation ATPase